MKKALEAFVVMILFGITWLSAIHTMEIATYLEMSPIATMAMVEVSFLVVTLVRMKQKKENKNVPWFLETMFYFTFTIITGSNVWGLSDKPFGWIVGCIISLALLGFENILFWSATKKSEELKTLSIRDRRKILKGQIKEEKFKQEMEWMLFEAGKPDLKLIEKVREADEERKRVELEKLPDFFTSHSNVVPFRKPVVKETLEMESIVPQEPKKQPIGFVQYEELKQTSSSLFVPNTEAREQALQTAKQMADELGRLPKQIELIKKGLTKHYAKMALDTLKSE